MSDIIRHQGMAYILATSPRLETRTLTLKDGDSFAVLDRYGDTTPIGRGEQGVYHRGTRVLSHHEFRLDRQRPLLLSSTVHERNAFIAVDLTNPDIQLDDGTLLKRGSIHIFRTLFLLDGAFHCRTRLQNFGERVVDTELSYLFDADFADVFEVRGMTRAARGERQVERSGEGITLTYTGLDGVIRSARVTFSQAPTSLDGNAARFSLSLAPGHVIEQFHLAAFTPDHAEQPSAASFDLCQRTLVDRLQFPAACRVTSVNDQFNHWVARSTADLAMLVTQMPDGPYPYAGVPWFSTVFGRDGLISAMQLLWIEPAIAKGVLTILAASQAESVDPTRDAEPGKILHEARYGEMANLGEVPFSRYYGSADATPLFIMLAAAYAERTGDDALLQRIWPNILAALNWIDRHGDVDGDGFVEYIRRRPEGLINQGWKDSDDSISHADGSLAEGAIALCEVQAYVFAAKRGAARLARHFGDHDLSQRLEDQAETLRRKFEHAFWVESLGTYALALDGAKHPCRVVASNAGHALFCGIASHERAKRVAATLLAEPMFSGWGVRTLGKKEKRYNPMSYHNGSVWPHDNAMIGAGLAQYGIMGGVQSIFSGIFDSALSVDLLRLPELFCGFDRQNGQGPTLYPVACIPQAWASGAAFMLLQASLGLTLRARPARIIFDRPCLPAFLPSIDLMDIRVDGSRADLRLSRHPSGCVTVEVLARDGEVEVRVLM
ncbi:MAG TPA: amylo-alpha-1,6-glucosidase [Rhodospirillaceae bacterium]|nr:amylo-alpha-1,6-glucosidase [Rhodospirillaceae bacterium]